MAKRFLLTDCGDGSYRLVQLGDVEKDIVCYVTYEDLKALQSTKQVFTEKNYPGSSNPYG